MTTFEFYLLDVSGRFKKPNVAIQAFVTQGVMTADLLQSRDAPEWLIFKRDLNTALYNTAYFSAYSILTNNIYCSEFLRSYIAENQAMQKSSAWKVWTAKNILVSIGQRSLWLCLEKEIPHNCTTEAALLVACKKGHWLNYENTHLREHNLYRKAHSTQIF